MTAKVDPNNEIMPTKYLFKDKSTMKHGSSQKLDIMKRMTQKTVYL